MKKLNWGCGSIQPKDWLNYDIDPQFNALCGIDSVEFWDPTRAPFDDDTFDIIVAHCSLQIVEWHSLVAQLQDLRRILKPGGVIRISLPDIWQGFKAWDSGDKGWFPNGEDDLDERFSAWLTWYSTTKSLLTIGALRSKLANVGFEHIRPVSFKKTSSAYPESIQLDTREGECYFVEAIK